MARKTTKAGKLFKNASKVRLRQLKAGKPISMKQAEQKAAQMIEKRGDANATVDVVFRKLSSGTPYVTRKAKSGTSSAKTGPTKKTKTVRRIAERRGISRKEANAIRKSRKG